LRGESIFSFISLNEGRINFRLADSTEFLSARGSSAYASSLCIIDNTPFFVVEKPPARCGRQRAVTRLTIGILKHRFFLLKLDAMAHLADLHELQNVVGKYATQYNLVKAAAPLAGAGVMKMVSRNKMVHLALVGSGIWFAVNEISTPMMRMIRDQFGFVARFSEAFDNERSTIHPRPQ
jgi:hypothetical protein